MASRSIGWSVRDSVLIGVSNVTLAISAIREKKFVPPSPKHKNRTTKLWKDLYVSEDFKPGLEGVIAFESTIAEPDKEGSALRYRGVDIEDLVGRVTFGNVWGLLVDDEFNPGLPPAEPFPLPVHSGDVRVDVQSAIAMLAPAWGFKPLLDISDEEARSNLARASVMVLSYVAQSARGTWQPMVPQTEVDKAHTVVERMMIRWRGEPDPLHIRAIDAYFVSAAEHGMNASTFTARVIASTGADVAASLSGAIGAMSGPLHGGAPARVLSMIEGVEKMGDARAYVKGIMDRGERLMGFGHRVYRAEDPRARTLRRTAKELGAPRYEVALELEKAALAELHERHPERVLETNVEFWAAIVLDFAEVPAPLFTSMFTAARTAGWSAHILEQKRTGRLIRPSSRYVGPGPRSPRDVKGWDETVHALHN
jgi:citrate synthase